MVDGFSLPSLFKWPFFANERFSYRRRNAFYPRNIVGPRPFPRTGSHYLTGFGLPSHSFLLVLMMGISRVSPRWIWCSSLHLSPFPEEYLFSIDESNPHSDPRETHLCPFPPMTWLHVFLMPSLESVKLSPFLPFSAGSFPEERGLSLKDFQRKREALSSSLCVPSVFGSKVFPSYGIMPAEVQSPLLFPIPT